MLPGGRPAEPTGPYQAHIGTPGGPTSPWSPWEGAPVIHQEHQKLQAVHSKDVPFFDGDLNDYMRRIELFEMVDGGDPNLRALRLMSVLKGDVWEQVPEAIDPHDLKGPSGM